MRVCLNPESIGFPGVLTDRIKTAESRVYKKIWRYLQWKQK